MSETRRNPLKNAASIEPLIAACAALLVGGILDARQLGTLRFNALHEHRWELKLCKMTIKAAAEDR